MITHKKECVEYLIQEIRNNVDVAVLAMSGGADSTLVAVLSTLALGKENVYSLHLPYGETDLKKFNANSLRVAEKLGVNVLKTNISAISDAINDGVKAMLGDVNSVNDGNARSRSRMTLLYGVAHELGNRLNKRVRVMGTGNLSEDFIGYDTKGGDALADIFSIGELFKSEVYELLEYFVEEDVLEESMIDYTPSAGLWEGQTDEDELGYTYNKMEESIRRALVNETKDDNEVDMFVMNRHYSNKHKHEAPPVIRLRDKGFLK